MFTLRRFSMLTQLATTALITMFLLSQSILSYVFAKAGKYGFVDDDGIHRIPAQFDKALDFTENMAPAARVAGTKVYKRGSAGPNCRIQALRWGYINPQGKVVIPFGYDDARPFSEGRAAVLSGSKWGFIDTNGRWVASPQFESVNDFHDGMARVQMVNKGLYGYIDKAGNLTVRPQFQEAGDFRDGVAVVGISRTSDTLSDRTGRVIVRISRMSDTLLDRTGRVIAQKGRLRLLGQGLVAYRDSYHVRTSTPLTVDMGVADSTQYAEWSKVADEVADAVIEADAPIGLMNTAGKIITPAVFDSVSAFSDSSIAAAKQEGRWTFIDQSGSPVASIAFVDANGKVGEMSEGLASVQVGNRFGFVDRSGEMAISPRFLSVSKFTGGLAAACVGTGEAPEDWYPGSEQRCGFIDRTGQYKISPRFSDAGRFKQGLALVYHPVFAEKLVINQKGRIVLRRNWHDESRFEPFGNCQFPPPPAAVAPPPDYSVVVNIGSIPEGASVYLVPAWDWQQHRDGRQLLDDPDALAAYLVTQGLTPLENVSLPAKVYMGVFQLQGQRKIARVVVAAHGPRQITVGF
jgi:hypothetical protein